MSETIKTAIENNQKVLAQHLPFVKRAEANLIVLKMMLGRAKDGASKS